VPVTIGFLLAQGVFDGLAIAASLDRIHDGQRANAKTKTEDESNDAATEEIHDS
jgi:hypothetical protein